MLSQICWIQALKFEDATKIAMYRTGDLLYTFLFQYFFLGIVADFFSMLGGFLIGVGMFIVIAFKIIDKKEEQKQRDNVEMKLMHSEEPEVSDRKELKENCCKKFILYKF